MKRKLISFSGLCPMNCKHCYMHELESSKECYTSDISQIDDLIKELGNKDEYDIVYISRRRENFVDESAGIELAEGVYKACNKHILIITRSNLSDECIGRLQELSNNMKEKGHHLIVAVSIAADKSYGVLEDIERIPSPEARCDVLKRLHNAGILTIFMARPILPDRIIPVKEVIDLIHDNAEYLDAVVSSGIAVNDQILDRLGIKAEDLHYLPGNNQEYLIGSEAKNIKYVDVIKELDQIRVACDEVGRLFFDHSLKAVEYLIA